MLEFSQSAQELASELYQQQLRLESFASLSICDSTAGKDRYLESVIQLLFKIPIDSANGCVFAYESKTEGSKVTYSATYNAVFACWLLCAAKALCDGDLSHHGKLMIEALDQNMWSPANEGFIEKKDFDGKSLPFFIEANSLTIHLSEDENKLLDAYLNGQLSRSNDPISLGFGCSLAEAALRAEMSIKQAQIVDTATFT